MFCLLDAECEKTMSVLVDDVETLVHFIEVDVSSQQVIIVAFLSLVTMLTGHVTDDVIGHLLRLVSVGERWPRLLCWLQLEVS